LQKTKDKCKNASNREEPAVKQKGLVGHKGRVSNNHRSQVGCEKQTFHPMPVSPVLRRQR